MQAEKKTPQRVPIQVRQFYQNLLLRKRNEYDKAVLTPCTFDMAHTERTAFEANHGSVKRKQQISSCSAKYLQIGFHLLLLKQKIQN